MISWYLTASIQFLYFSAKHIIETNSYLTLLWYCIIALYNGIEWIRIYVIQYIFYRQNKFIIAQFFKKKTLTLNVVTSVAPHGSVAVTLKVSEKPLVSLMVEKLTM